MALHEAYVYDAVRTPRGVGAATGALAVIKPVELLAQLFQALRERNPAIAEQVEDVVLGCSVQTGEQGSNLARIAALHAGFGEACSGVTLNRFCASGVDALVYAALKVASGMEGLVVAGGVESLSRVGMFADAGPWFSDLEVSTSTRFVHMGVAADLVAALEGISRTDCDAYALYSQRRAARARDEGRFKRCLVPARASGGAVVLDRDECIRESITAEELASLAPAFTELDRQALPWIRDRHPSIGELDPVHHVGSAPSLADAAALLLLGDRRVQERLGLRPRARVRGFANLALEPLAVLTALAPVAEKALRSAGLGLENVSLFECNESFSAPVLAFARKLKLDLDRVNVNGGAIALGHPLGATGAILTMTLLEELERRGDTIGMVCIAGGAGIAEALVLERC